MTLKFGTDGVRGVADTELTPSFLRSLGAAAARVLGDGSPFLVGRDTRESGPRVFGDLAAGLGRVVDLGVVPTPAVAFLSAERGLPAAMISASHNPYPDNGVKFFLPGGRKLSDEVEEELESALGSAAAGAAPSIETDPSAVASYERHVAESAGSLDGLHVVIDCANGAASEIGPRVLRAMGARVDVLFDAPDGRNINEGCGSTHPEALQQAVAAAGADAGLAFDGDADRVLAVDAEGRLVDGDQLLALLAVDLRGQGRLHGDTVVVTVMSNLGLRLAMAREGIAVHETAVGDRYVLEALEAGGWSLGGEQSGHIIFRDLATTGDGLLTGVQVLDAVRRSGRSLAELATVMERLPQVLRNVRVGQRDGLEDAAAVWAAVGAWEERLGERGRVLLRPSGTEPVVRVMVEAADHDTAEQAATALAAAVAAWGDPATGK